MGEVYRAYDARLDREVALKRVRPGAGDPELATRRFRREARAAAGLRHPSLVQVYDWVESDSGSWLVMELVEGRSLRDVLALEGSLAIDRVIGIARDLLEGLAAAHDAGLVHRDLKPSNVMLTAAGSGAPGRGERACILDFGLAKSQQPGEGSQLSDDGKLVGTLSALAPEQVLGEPVDARTDLFALGCLLFESLTLRRPFLVDNAGETLNRICFVHPTPPEKLRPEVPTPLSAFVQSLLEKDPRRRPASAMAALGTLGRLETTATGAASITMDEPTDPSKTIETGTPPSFTAPPSRGASAQADRPQKAAAGRVLAVAIVAVAAIALFAWLNNSTPVTADPIYVAIPATVVGASAGLEVDLAVRTIHTALLQGLIDLEGIVAVEVPADAPTAIVDLARELASDEVLASTFECDASCCSASLRRVTPEGEVHWARSFTAEPARLPTLREATLSHLAEAYPGLRKRPGAPKFEVRPDDYGEFLRLHQGFQSRKQGLSTEELIETLNRLAETSPRFAAIPILTAHIALQQYRASREEEDLQTAQAAAERARELAPEDPRTLMLAARLARVAGDLDEAEQWLDEVRRLEPGHSGAEFQLVLIYEQRDELEHAKELLLDLVRRHPSAYHLFHGGDLLYRQGDLEGARRLIQQGLERASEDFDGLSRLGQLELAHGDLERAATVYRQLVERSPEETELTNLGTALMMLGRLEEARHCFTRIVEASPSESRC